MFDKKLLTRAVAILAKAQDNGYILATAESATGGLLGGLLTSVSGVSHLYRGGVVVYCPTWKKNLLGVGHGLLAEKGTVDGAVARAMVAGVFDHGGDDTVTHAIAITGMAGEDSAYALPTRAEGDEAPPNPDKDKPDGLVFIAVGNSHKKIVVHEYHFEGDRWRVREQALASALDCLEQFWQDEA